MAISTREITSQSLRIKEGVDALRTVQESVFSSGNFPADQFIESVKKVTKSQIGRESDVVGLIGRIGKHSDRAGLGVLQKLEQSFSTGDWRVMSDTMNVAKAIGLRKHDEDTAKLLDKIDKKLSFVQRTADTAGTPSNQPLDLTETNVPITNIPDRFNLNQRELESLRKSEPFLKRDHDKRVLKTDKQKLADLVDEQMGGNQIGNRIRRRRKNIDLDSLTGLLTGSPEDKKRLELAIGDVALRVQETDPEHEQFSNWLEEQAKPIQPEVPITDPLKRSLDYLIKWDEIDKELLGAEPKKPEFQMLAYDEEGNYSTQLTKEMWVNHRFPELREALRKRKLEAQHKSWLKLLMRMMKEDELLTLILEKTQANRRRKAA